MASAALQALRRTVTVDWRQQSQQGARELLLRTAREGHARIMRDQASRAGVIPEWEAYGDHPGRPIEQAQQRIVYRYRYLREVVIALMRALEAASPVLTGAYRKSHALYVDGRPVALATPIKPGQEVMISNPVPYARQLEIGKTESGRDFLVSVPNRIYERVAKGAVARRYRNAARVEFGYVWLPAAALSSSPGRRHKRPRRGARVRAPAIFIAALS